MSRRQITRLQKILIGIGLLFVCITLDLLTDWHTVVTALPFLLPLSILGLDMLITAFYHIKRFELFNEYAICSLCCLIAFFTGHFAESCATMLFLQIRELFRSYNVSKARKGISYIADITAEQANLKTEKGITTVDVSEVKKGDILVVYPGERVPLDGVVVLGNTSLQTFAVSGEKQPSTVVIGDNILSGSVNTFSEIEIKVTKTVEDSVAFKIKQTVNNAIESKSKPQKFIEKTSKYYFLVIFAISVLTALVSIISGIPFYQGIHRGTVILAISTLCHISLSLPLSVYAGIHSAADNGIIIKSAEVLEALSVCDTVIFDKTGTLTKGEFKISKVVPTSIPAYKLLELAATAEYYSTHPIALSLKKEYEGTIDKSNIREVNEITGCGVIAKIGERRVAVGNRKLMKQLSLRVIDTDSTVVHVAVDSDYLGYIVIEDELKSDCKQTVNDLKRINIKNICMFTGDNKDIAGRIAAEIGIHDYYCEMLPLTKVKKVKSFAQSHRKTCFVGDGINDALSIKEANVGIVMGGVENDKSTEVADVIIMGDNPRKISTAINIGRKTIFATRFNIVLNIAVKILCLILGVLGALNLWIVSILETLILILTTFTSIKPFKK